MRPSAGWARRERRDALRALGEQVAGQALRRFLQEAHALVKVAHHLLLLRQQLRLLLVQGPLHVLEVLESVLERHHHGGVAWHEGRVRVLRPAPT